MNADHGTTWYVGSLLAWKLLRSLIREAVACILPCGTRECDDSAHRHRLPPIGSSIEDSPPTTFMKTLCADIAAAADIGDDCRTCAH